MEEDKSLGHRVLRILVWLLLPYLVLGAFYLLVVFRLQLRPINDMVRLFNKRIVNPVMMALDRRHWYAAVLWHEGRRSGKVYATPVTAEPTEDGFVIPLSYGEEVDWLKNIRATGQCTIEARDGTYTVVEPEVVDQAKALAGVSLRARLMFRLFGVEWFVKVRRLPKTSSWERDYRRGKDRPDDE